LCCAVYTNAGIKSWHRKENCDVVKKIVACYKENHCENGVQMYKQATLPYMKNVPKANSKEKLYPNLEDDCELD